MQSDDGDRNGEMRRQGKVVVANPRVLAVVPARGGSRGIPRKNLQPLGGHPLIAWSIASALASHRISRVIVSTDDEEIAEVARQYGAEVPFLRPAELAAADTPDLPVFRHALAWLAEHEQYRPEIVVQLRPTSPLRPNGLIDHGVALLLENPKADCVRSVTPAGQNPYKMWRQDCGEFLTPLLQGDHPEPYNLPRQMLPRVLWQTGHLDVIRYQTIAGQSSLTGRRVRPMLVEPEYCVDLDTPRDLAFAEWTISRGDVEVDRPELPGKQGVIRGVSR